MKSLFVQLWLAFLAVMAVTLGSSLAVSYASALRRSDDVGHVSPVVIAASAQQILDRKGIDGITGWALDELHQQPEMQIYFVDPAGHEMFNRRVHGQPVPQAIGRPRPVVRAPDGTFYKVFVQRTRGLVFDFWTILFRPWMLGCLILSISGFGCASLAWLMSRPVRELRRNVREIAKGNLETQLDDRLLARRDELGGLADDIQQMTHDLRALIASRELLLRNVSHELRSPLARLRLAADLAGKHKADRGQALDRIGREVERIDAIIGQILYFSRSTRPDDLACERLDLARLVAEAAEDARIEADKAAIKIFLKSSGALFVNADESKLRTAVENVLRNAIRHAPRGSTIIVQSGLEDATARVRILDKGAGTGDGDSDWVFLPFRRGTASDGSGLGLAITSRIVQLHGGSASAWNRSGGGFCVELALPALPRPSSSASRPAPTERGHVSSVRVADT
jgi:two-component system, OmpR family, sensor kinase